MPNKYTLDTESEAFVERQIASGRFDTATDVIHAALDLMKNEEHTLSRLDRAIASGMADVEAGRLHELEDVRRTLAERYAGVAKAR